MPQPQREAATESDTGVNHDIQEGENCSNLDNDCDGVVDATDDRSKGDSEECADDTDEDRSMIALSPSEHDAFCALWQAVKWDVVPYCHGRIPRPDELVRQYFHETTDVLVFIRRLTKDPFKLLEFEFTHHTDRHQGDTYETASEARWSHIAQRIRVKRELARPASPQESLEASIEAREARIGELRQQHEDINREYEKVMTEFEARLAENKRLVEVEEAAIEKMRDLLQQVSELEVAQSAD